MTSSTALTDVQQILLELESKVLADPNLTKEWADAMRDAPFILQDPRSWERFRVWFLLERPSTALGATPILAWGPDHVEESSAWEALLDSFLGIFRGGEATPDGQEWVDLWTGRSVLISNDTPSLQANEICLARLFLQTERCHAPLQGEKRIASEGVVEAVGKDLAKTRAENTHASLSSETCELLFVKRNSAQQEKHLADPEELGKRVEALLEPDENWSMDRVHQVLEEGGVAALLEALAFETSLDLEELRRLIPEYAQAALHPKDKALSIPEDDGQQTGPRTTPGMSVWKDAFSWEHPNLNDSEKDVLEDFLQYLDARGELALDACDLRTPELLAFLLTASQPNAFLKRCQNFAPFLQWLITEQQAEVGVLQEYLNSKEMLQRFTLCLDFNQAYADIKTSAVVRVASLNPLTVLGEKKESMEVTGPLLQHDLEGKLTEGDLLQGNWTAGRFQATFALPKQALAE